MEGYKNLDITSRSVQLRLPTSDTRHWLSLSFVPDPRLARLVPLERSVKEGRTRFDYRFPNRPGEFVLAQPQEIRLIRRGSSYFATIRLTLQPTPSPLPLTQTAAGKYSPQWVIRKIRDDAPDLSLVTCAVDLAVRHLGAASVAREGRVFARRILHNRFFRPNDLRERALNIPSLPEIAAVRRRIRRAQRRSGRMSPAKDTCRRLWTHYRNLCEDHYKKAVAAIFAYALHHGAHLVIFEDLKMLNPDSANERGVNNALQNWNRGNIVRFAKMAAEDHGLRVVTVGAWWTSRLCARCGGMGVRFNQGKRRPWGQRRHTAPRPVPIDRLTCNIAPLGHWFLCPGCRSCLHADINASENLHRQFLGSLPTVKRLGSSRPPIYEVNGQRVEQARLEAAANELLLARTAPATPF
jgi:IS605 OrfB family transposase